MSNVLPEKLIGYIENKLGHKIKFVDYEVSSFLLDWFKAKADSRLTEQEKKIKIIKKILNNDFSKVSSELLDGIYPTAYKFDKNFAFDCLSGKTMNWSLPICKGLSACAPKIIGVGKPVKWRPCSKSALDK